MKNIFIFSVTVLFLVMGQGLWKIAATQIFTHKDTITLILKLFTNPCFVLGSIFYILSTGLWIYLLGQYDYSRLYPVFVGACMVGSLLLGLIFFKEDQSIVHKLLGCMLILLGIYVIAKHSS